MDRLEDALELRYMNLPLERFGVVLFGKIYAEASACLAICDDRWELKLFDTTYAPEVLKRNWPEDTKIVLFSNHPEGNIAPSAIDLRNLEFAPGAGLYIVCEDVCKHAW